jgi:hypothetical protein
MGIARHKLDDYYRKKIHAVEIPEGSELLPEQVTLPAFEQGLDCVAQQKRVQRTLRLLPEAYCASRKSGKIGAGTNYTAVRILSSDAHFPARTSHHSGFDPSFAP